MKKRILPILLALVMVMSLMPTIALADAPSGSIERAGITHDNGVLKNAVSVDLKNVNFESSVQVQLYSDETLLTTATLNTDKLGAGSYPYLTCCIATQTADEYWALTPWTPKDDVVPNKVVLFVDDNEMDTMEFTLNADEWAALPGTELFYTVTYMDGKNEIESVLVKADGTVKLFTPSKPGYIFMGWRNGNTTYGAGDTVVVTSDMTFTAVWANMPDVTPGGGDEPVVPSFPFYDVSANDWFYTAVKYAYDKGLMDGTDVNKFSPNSYLTRAMVWAVLARMDGETISGDSWMTDAQAWAVKSGVSDGTNPTGYVTREQLVTMLYRFAGEPAGAADISGYPDAATVSDWAVDAMSWAVKVGLIEGDDLGNLNPTANSTRAHAATFMMRFCENIL